MFKRIVLSWLALLSATVIFSGCMHTSEKTTAGSSPENTESQQDGRRC